MLSPPLVYTPKRSIYSTNNKVPHKRNKTLCSTNASEVTSNLPSQTKGHDELAIRLFLLPQEIQELVWRRVWRAFQRQLAPVCEQLRHATECIRHHLATVSYYGYVKISDGFVNLTAPEFECEQTTWYWAGRRLHTMTWRVVDTDVSLPQPWYWIGVEKKYRAGWICATFGETKLDASLIRPTEPNLYLTKGLLYHPYASECL